MTTAAYAQRLPLTAMLVTAAVVAGFFLFWRTASPLSGWTGVDLDFLFPPLLPWALLMLLGRAAAWAGAGPLAALTWGPTRSGRTLRASDALPLAERVLTDLAGFALVLALLDTVPTMAVALAERFDGAVVDGIPAYTRAFGAMGWSILILAPVAALRALTVARPAIGAVLAPPWSRLAVLGAAYVLLAPNGVLSAAVGVDGFAFRFVLALAMGIAYGALILRRISADLGPGRLRQHLRIALLTLEAAWIAMALGVLAALPPIVESILVDRFALQPWEAAAYTISLDRLTSPQAFAVLLPFAAIRVIGVFRSPVDAVLGFPVGRLALLAAVFVLFSADGVAFYFLRAPLDDLMVMLTLAIAVSYAGSVFANASRAVTGRRAPALAAAFTVAGSAEAAAAAGLAVWALVDHLPIANAALLDHDTVRSLGRNAMPYLNVLLDSRNALAMLAAALAFAWTLPWRPDSGLLGRARAPMTAVAFAVAGCLAWLTGAALSPMGHGTLLAGASLAAGLFALGVAQVAGAVAAALPNAALSPLVRWFAANRTRGMVFGAFIALYGLLFRPVLYEALWFAALYEYIALLGLLALALLVVVDLLRRDASAPEAPDLQWTGWRHHQQVLQDKADPRAALPAELRRRYVDFGEWRELWAYLMGLLYRHGAPLEEMHAVGRPLRAAARSHGMPSFMRQGNLRRLARASALNRALRAFDEALSGGRDRLSPVTREGLRQAAAQFIETGADVERIAIALTVANCQSGRDPHTAIYRWFPLLEGPDPVSRRFFLPWPSPGGLLRHRPQRVRLVEDAAAMLFGEPDAPRGPDSARLAGAAAT